jgi:hypothetical protein
MPIRAAVLALVVLFVSVPGPAPAAEPGVLTGPAHAWIASHARRLNGEAPREQRTSCEGDLNGDGHADVVVVYRVERTGGADDWQQFATVLTGSMAQFAATTPVKVGAKGERIVEACSVAAGVLALAGKEWAPADAACCPSRAGERRFTLAKGALVAAPAPSPGGP